MEEEKNVGIEESQVQPSHPDSLPPEEAFDPFDRMMLKKEGKEKESHFPAERSESVKAQEDKSKETSSDHAETIKKLEARAHDNQKFARSANQKIKETLKVLDQFVAEGSLEEDQAGLLLSILKKDGLTFSEDSFNEKIEEKSNNPFKKYKDMLDPELFSTYVDVSDDQEAAKKLYAFDQLLNEIDSTEADVFLKELSGLQSPMAVLKKIISYGEKYLDEGMGEVYKQGGFRKFLAVQKEETQKLQKELDKMKKKMVEYEPNESSGKFWLSSDSKGSDGSSDSLKGLDPFDKWQAQKQKRKKTSPMLGM